MMKVRILGSNFVSWERLVNIFPWKIIAGPLLSSKKTPETCNVPTLYIIEEIQKTRQMSSCCLGDRIYSFPCRASYFALGRIWRKDGWIHPFLLIILVQFIIFFKSSYCKIASAPRNSVPNTAVTTFAFSSVFILLLCFTYTAAFFIFVLLEPPFSYFCYWNLHFRIFVIGTSIFIFLLL